jgi:CubicO group peptidase (beta-lactamase class C family)
MPEDAGDHGRLLDQGDQAQAAATPRAGQHVKPKRALHQRGPQLAEMLLPGELPDGSSTDYGFGLMIRTDRGRRVVGHGGGIFGFASDLAYWPDDQVGIAVLCNTTGAPAQTICDRVRAAYDRLVEAER